MDNHNRCISQTARKMMVRTFENHCIGQAGIDGINAYPVARGWLGGQLYLNLATKK